MEIVKLKADYGLWDIVIELDFVSLLDIFYVVGTCILFRVQDRLVVQVGLMVRVPNSFLHTSDLIDIHADSSKFLQLGFESLPMT